jgi:hypothetical protein
MGKLTKTVTQGKLKKQLTNNRHTIFDDYEIKILNTSY